jgi:hypothetical protein
MKFALAISLSLVLGASTQPELAGSWKATQLGQGDRLAPLGRPYQAVIDMSGEKLLKLVFSGCNTETFIYRVDGARLTYACGEQGLMCTATLTSCAFPRIELDGSIPPREETCSDQLPYCTARLRQDDDLLSKLLRSASSWQYSKGSLTLSSASVNAQLRFVRNER